MLCIMCFLYFYDAVQSLSPKYLLVMLFFSTKEKKYYLLFLNNYINSLDL